MNHEIVTIDFHGQRLITIKNGGDILVAMKPVVEGIGLAWQSQHRKLSENNSRWGITEMVIPSKSGEQSTTCLPLRKLHGWLMTIHPNKIKDEVVRANVIVYQNECDDVLWRYFSEGIAINPRLEITPEQQSDLFTMVASINPDGRQRGAIWARFNRHFKIAKYSQLPQAKFEDAKNYLAEVYCNGEYIEREEAPIDFKGLLTNGMVDPSIPYPPEVEAAIERKAYTLSHECFSHIRQHLRKRVAYSCETGDPRHLNTERAMQLIEQGDIGYALAYPYHIQVRSVAKMMQSVAMMANDYSASISKAIN